jgi:type II secretory pathway pseudopilin PulG
VAPFGNAAHANAARFFASHRAFTYTELLVSVGIITLLTALMVPLVGQSRATAQSVACLAHLRQIGVAFVQYAADNGKRLPDPFEVQTSWEQILRKYVPEGSVFRCPADGELFPSVGSSYDWRDTGRSETTLAGRLITDTNRPDPVFAFEALPGWHCKGRMNAITLSGAGVSMDQEACMEDIQQPIRPPQPKKVRPQGGGDGDGVGGGHGGGSSWGR